MIPQTKFLLALTIGAVFAAGSMASAQQRSDAASAVPVITFTTFPLADAIGNLAQLTDINYILDPELPRTPVTFRRKNATAEQALGELLKENNLVLLRNTNTSVNRITVRGKSSAPIGPAQLGDGANAAIPLIVMDSVPLHHAIQNLISDGKLNITVDRKLTSFAAAGGRFVTRPMVSVRWHNITAKQAIAALMENYDLKLVKDPATSALQITVKDAPDSKAQPDQKAKSQDK